MRQLPRGWAEARLWELGKWGSGGTPRAGNAAYYGGGIPFTKIGDLPDGPFSETEDTLTEGGMSNSAAKLVPTGSLLVAMYGSIGKLGINTIPVTTNQAIAFLVPDPAISFTEFVFWALRSCRSNLVTLGQGGTQQNISQTILKQHCIGLPPLPEQRRIVTKLDGLFSKTRRAREELGRIPRLVERYKQAILAAAFVEAQRSAVNVVSLGDLAKEVRNGLSKKPSEQSPGTPILRISAVRPFVVQLEDRRYYPDTERVSAVMLLENGDLLFTRYNGNPNFVAVCGMVRGLSENLLYPDKLIRVRLDGRVSPRFIELVCAAPQTRAWLMQFIKTAAGQHGISGKDLRRLPIPLLPMTKQETIVLAIEAALTRIDKLLREHKGASRMIDLLDQSILAKAFRGELVRQDPSDEPASVLLDRVRAERATHSKTKGRRTGQRIEGLT